MKTYFHLAIKVAIDWTIIYSLFAFVRWSPYPGDWSVAARFWAGLLGIIVFAVAHKEHFGSVVCDDDETLDP